MRSTLLITAFFPPELGGLEHYWREVARRWPRDQRFIVLTNPHSGQAAFDQAEPYKIIRLNLFGWPITPSWLPLIWKMPSIIRQNNIDILLFGHYANYAVIGVFIKWLMKKSFRVMTHGFDTVIPRRGFISRWLMKRVLLNADKIYCNSQFTRRSLIDLGIPKDNLTVAPPAIDLDSRLIIDRITAKQKLGLNGKFVILSLARLIKLKGVDLVIRALAGLPERTGLVYVIIGNGPEMAQLQKLTADLGLSESVRFIGQISDQPGAKSIWYSAADLYVLTTRSVDDHEESFGISYLEAGSYKLPVIASRSGGASELIRDNETGILIAPDSETELRRALKRMINKPSMRLAMGERLFDLVKNGYTWESTLSQLSE